MVGKSWKDFHLGAASGEQVRDMVHDSLLTVPEEAPQFYKHPNGPIMREPVVEGPNRPVVDPSEPIPNLWPDFPGGPYRTPPGEGSPGRLPSVDTPLSDGGLYRWPNGEIWNTPPPSVVEAPPSIGRPPSVDFPPSSGSPPSMRPPTIDEPIIPEGPQLPGNLPVPDILPPGDWEPVVSCAHPTRASSKKRYNGGLKTICLQANGR